MNTVPEATIKKTLSTISIALDQVSYSTPDEEFHLSVDQLTVSRGERIAMTGPSGTGKTTLLSMISGYRVPSSGKISVLGQDLTSMNRKEREQFRLTKIGIVFQDFRLIEYLSVRDNIALSTFLATQKMTRNQTDRVTEIASQLQIAPLLKRFPSQLSQGERQRVAIGRAVFQEPELILADEPTGNLDPKIASETLDFLFQAIEKFHSTLVMVTHDHSLLPRFTRHIDLEDFSQKAV